MNILAQHQKKMLASRQVKERLQKRLVLTLQFDRMIYPALEVSPIVLAETGE
jgi:hypothetical protein